MDAKVDQLIMPRHFDAEVHQAIIEKCIEVLWREYAADAPTACLAGMSMIAYGLSLRMREEGTAAAESLRDDVLSMIEHDLDKISLEP